MRYSKQITYLLLIAVLFVQVIGLLLPFAGDAGKYAAISKNIYLNHDFLNLEIHGSPYYQKPPFLMWLSSAGYFLFGNAGNFTTRFFPFLFSLLMLVSTFKLARIFYSKEIATTATLFIGTSQIFFFYNTDLHTDVILASCTTAAIWLISSFLYYRKRTHVVLAFVFIGLGMLTKGPIALAVPVFAIGAHIVIKRKFTWIFKWEWIAGLAIVLVVLLPYLMNLYKTFGWDGPLFYLWTNNAGRISGNYSGDNSDPFYYLYNLIVFTLPWAIFYIIGLFKALYQLFQARWKTTSEYITLGGAVLLLVVLSISKMKSPNYFYPAIPLLSIIAAKYFHTITTTRTYKSLNTISVFQNSLVWLLVFIVLIVLFPTQQVMLWILLVLLLLLTISGYLIKASFRQRILRTGLATIVALNLTINGHVLPELFNYQSTLKAVEVYNEKAAEDAIFYTYRYPQFEFFFYAKTPGLKIIDEGTREDPVMVSLEEAIANKGAWFWASEWSYKQIKNAGANIESVYVFDNYFLTDINWKFLNPKTRESALKKMYLIETKHENN